MTKLYFLPGALGRTEFWHPVSELLTYPGEKIHVTWPGFNGVSPDPNVRGVGDLASRLATQIVQPSALIAQSMGGVVAMLVALQKPELITHLVLSVTSGGMDLASLDGEDWRPSLRANHPGLPDWFISYHPDLAPRLSALRNSNFVTVGRRGPDQSRKGRSAVGIVDAASRAACSSWRGPQSGLRPGASGCAFD